MNRLLIFYLALIVIAGCARKQGFELRGTVEGTYAEWIYLDEQGITSAIPVDSSKIKKNGSFTVSAETEFPRFYNLHLGNQVIIPLLMGPGEKPVIHCRARNFSTDYSIEGSEGSAYLKLLNERLAVTTKKLDSIRLIIDTVPGLSSEELNELNDEFIRIFDDQRRFSIQFVLDHPNSLASLYALYQKVDEETYVFYKNRDIQIMKITGQALDTIYPQSAHVQSLINNATFLENQIISAQMQKMVDDAGYSIPEIALPDRFGDTIRLSSLKGKVVLLSFWASWDEPSSDLNDYLKELYDRYKNRGFEIFQVSFDSDRNTWSRNIILDGLPWINVSELSYPNSTVAGVYNVAELPTLYLINRKHEIVVKNPPAAELEEKIEELL